MKHVTRTQSSKKRKESTDGPNVQPETRDPIRNQWVENRNQHCQEVGTILKEAKKKNDAALNKKMKNLHLDALYRALRKKQPGLIHMLIELDSLDSKLWELRSLERIQLQELYKHKMETKDSISRILKNMSGLRKFTSNSTKEDEVTMQDILPGVGRIIDNLPGCNYLFMYQDKDATGDLTPGIWHLFVWAVLTNQRDTAERLWYRTGHRIGSALIAYHLLKGLAENAEIWTELELAENLRCNSRYFEELAENTLHHLAIMDEHVAFQNLLTPISEQQKYLTPLSIAYYADSKKFLSHQKCHKLITLIWMNSMSLNTQLYKRVPLFGVFGVKWITFEDDIYRIAQTQQPEPKEPACLTTWNKIKIYFTAPATKYVQDCLSYIIFLGLLTNLLLTELRPLDTNGSSDVTWCEWLTYVWFFALSLQIIMQVVSLTIKQPVSPENDKIEYSKTVQSVHSFLLNTLDILMMTEMFVVDVVLRFTLERHDLVVVRICFCITLLLCYMRILKFFFVLRELGPRIVTIALLLDDLIKFFVILMVFIVSFGVIFQSLIEPYRSPSWDLLKRVLWRPYWQMYGEIFVEDATDGMGLDVPPRNCTTDRALAKSQPETYELCHEWILPVFLGIFMMITNIMLLSLLIAIFSKSFQQAEERALEVWQYYQYVLCYEYYHQVWLPPPLNIPWCVFLLMKKIILCCQYRCQSSTCCRNKDSPDDIFYLDWNRHNGPMETKAVDKIRSERKS